MVSTSVRLDRGWPRPRIERAAVQATLRRAARTAWDEATLPFTVGSELPDVAGSRARPLTFGRLDADPIEAEIYSHLDPVRRRIWLQRALVLLVRGLLLAAVLWAIGMALRFAADADLAAVIERAAWAPVVAAVLLAARQRVLFADAARVADRHLGLPQVLGTAVEAARGPADGRTVRRLRMQASQLLVNVDAPRIVRLRPPWRDLRVLLCAVAIGLLFSYLATLDLVWPGTVRTADVAADPPADAIADDAATPIAADAATDASLAALDPQLLDPSLDQSQQDLAAQNLSPDDLAQRLADVQANLSRRAEALAQERRALDGLANALGDSSSTSDASDSIRKGDYQKATQQLSDLAKQAQQLSSAARKDLANKLANGAAATAPDDADLASKMASAAQALGSNDPAQASQALNDLAQAVQQAGARASSLADPNEPFDPSQAPQAGDATTSPDATSADAAPSDAQAGAADGQDAADAGADAASNGSPDGASDASSGSGAQGTDQGAGTGSGAGAGPGQARPATGQPAGQPGSANVLDLTGRPSPNGASAPDPGAGVPLVATNDGTVGAAGPSAATTASGEPVDVPAETNSVPLEKRQIVKDYFSDPGSGS